MDLSDPHGRPTGTFYLEVREGGRLVQVVREANMVVNSSQIILASLLGGGLGAITKFGVGSSAAAAALGDVALTNPTLTPIDAVSFPEVGKVRFAFSLPAELGNGAAINEFGLLSDGRVLFARKVRATALLKTSDISLSGAWTISFRA